MKSDLDLLMQLMEVSFDPHYREAWTRRQVEDSLVTPSTFMRLISADGNHPGPGEQAAGFFLARQAADEVELLLIAVRPDQRGRGLGMRLLEDLFRQSLDRAATTVFLEMRADNPAVALYQKVGFTQIGVRPDYYRTAHGETIDAHTFAREL